MYPSKSTEATTLNRAVTYFITKDMQPVYTVERSSFKFLVSKLNPRYNIPSRKHFTEVEIPRLTLRLYTEVRETVVKPKQAEIVFVVIKDLWTSRARHPYTSLTVYFIDNSWAFQTITLETLPLFQDHSGQNISEAILDVFDNRSLDATELVATTTDNGSNFVAAFNSLEWPHISCFGHNLHLAINKAVNVDRLYRAVKRRCSLVEVFRHSLKK